jgi:GT2 family glycosyltransferase
VVHWHNEELLAELTAAWPRDPRFELVVVDNGSAAPLALGPARLVTPDRNLGFAGGANAGIAAARAPIVLILNPDAVPEEGALDRLLEGFAAWPDAAGLAPRLVGADGEPQTAWQLRPLPSAWDCLLHTFPLGGRPQPTPEPAPGAPVEQPAAAALALRREALERIGGFDADFHPAWFEDVDLARRLHDAGAVLRYWPAARFRHRLGSTVPRLGYGPFLWIYYRNLTRYLRKHHGRGWAAAARGGVILGALVRLLLLPFHRPQRAAARWEAARGLGTVIRGAMSGWRDPHPLAPSPTRTPTLPGEGENAGGGAPLPDGREGMGEGSGVRGNGVAVCIVTYNSAADLPGCLQSVARLEHRPLEIVVVDCASTDNSLETTRQHAPADVPFQAVGLTENVGFAGGMNAAFQRTAAPFVLTLNADARPAPDYVSRLLALLAAHPEMRVGAVTGRLVRPADPTGIRQLDACGMRLTRTWRHLDRGSGEVDRGQWSIPERVFGATGAASLFRRAALDDAAVEGEVFDSRFHSFREDAELCFRLRERGWEILYEPSAVAEHRRFNLPERRSAMPALVNYHSLKNRYLLRLYHQTAGNLVRTFVPAFVRDLMALGYVILRERSSWSAYVWLWRHRAEILRRRRILQERRTVPAGAIDRWFSSPGEPLG